MRFGQRLEIEEFDLRTRFEERRGPTVGSLAPGAGRVVRNRNDDRRRNPFRRIDPQKRGEDGFVLIVHGDMLPAGRRIRRPEVYDPAGRPTEAVTT
jgi:hypothetical protein